MFQVVKRDGEIADFQMSKITSAIDKAFDAKEKRANVEKAHPHRFRRTALTNALNRGMPLQEAMILAGHSKPETTMRYCTVDQEAVQYHHKKYLSA